MFLFQIINVESSQVSYFGTKVEIKMRKAEIESWTRLGQILESQDTKENIQPSSQCTEKITNQVEAVDLDDL